MLLSIVIPVYNTELAYLKQALDPYISHYDERIELVVVDDGSEQETYSDLKKLLSKCEMPHQLIRQENRGQNDARNRGVAAAHGDYIALFDSDDTIEWNLLKVALGIIEKKRPQLFAFKFNTRHSTDVPPVPDDASWSWEIVDSNQILRDFIDGEIGITTLVYQRQLLLDNQLIQGDFRIGEDIVTLVPILVSADSIIRSDLRIYNYIYRDTSLISSFNTESSKDILVAFDALFDSFPVQEAYSAELEALVILHVLYYGGCRFILSTKSVAAKPIFFDYVEQRFPQWRSSYLLHDSKYASISGFKQLTSGRWRTFHFCYKGKQAAKHLLGPLLPYFRKALHRNN